MNYFYKESRSKKQFFLYLGGGGGGGWGGCRGRGGISGELEEVKSLTKNPKLIFKKSFFLGGGGGGGVEMGGVVG